MSMGKHALSRRAMLAQIPAAVAVASPASALAAHWSQLDVALLAAIEAHKQAEIAYAEAFDLIDEVLAKQQGRRVMPADYMTFDLAAEASEAAFTALSAAMPASLAGLHALLAYGLQIDYDGYELRPIVEAVLRSPLLAQGRSARGGAGMRT